MDEKRSPAGSTTSGSTGNNGTPQSRNSPISRLIVTKQPPTHVFADEWFEAQFDIDIVKGKGSLDGAEFVASLHHQKSKRAVSEDDVIFTVVPATPVRFSSKESSPKRKRTLRCKILPKQIRRDKATSFFIQLSPRDGSGPIEVMPASTRQVNAVNYKINVSVTEEWEPIWYKDEGGRDKCMTIEAALLDRDGTLCVGQSVPLHLTLFYDHSDQPVRVSRQSIFRVIGPLVNKTDAQSGKAILKFRVDDVSKNHQGQDFRVEVAPDPKAKGFKDVAPDFSPAVSIRSKRNKRQKLGPASRSDQPRYPASPAIPYQPQPRVQPSMMEELRTDAAFRGVNIPRLREAMKGVVQWTEEVVNGLYQLQWQVIGYAQNPDGSPDFGRPYYNMPNPNERIARVLSMYSEVTRDHLRFLLNSVEGSGPPLQGPVVALPRTAPRIPDEALAMAGQGFLPFPMDPRLGAQGVPMQASMPQQVPFFPPGHPMSMPPDVFRDKGAPGFPMQSAAGLPQSPSQSPRQQQSPMGRPANQMLPGAMMRMSEMGGMPMSGPAASMPVQSVRGAKGEPLERGQMHPGRPFGEDTRENEVAYVLAKQHKATRTGERLGFPAYSEAKEILGFYRESSTKVGVGQFVPISHHQEEFGPLELVQATQILTNAMEAKDDSVYALKDWGSIANLIDHALVYDWSKDIAPAGGTSGESGD